MSDFSSSDVRRLPVAVLGWSVSLTFVVTYVLCILYGLLGFTEGIHSGLLPQILPGFTWLTWGSFFIGAIEAFIYGWYVAVVFGLIFNFISVRFA